MSTRSGTGRLVCRCSSWRSWRMLNKSAWLPTESSVSKYGYHWRLCIPTLWMSKGTRIWVWSRSSSTIMVTPAHNLAATRDKSWANCGNATKISPSDLCPGNTGTSGMCKIANTDTFKDMSVCWGSVPNLLRYQLSSQTRTWWSSQESHNLLADCEAATSRFSTFLCTAPVLPKRRRARRDRCTPSSTGRELVWFGRATLGQDLKYIYIPQVATIKTIKWKYWSNTQNATKKRNS